MDIKNNINIDISELSDIKKTLVVCRYKENLEWLKKIDNNTKIIVYNKGQYDINHLKQHNNITIIDIPNISFEEFAYIKYIIDHYNSLTDITIFCQGCPFPHSPDFISLINNYTDRFHPVQPLTIGYGKGNPPQNFLEISSQYMFMDKYTVHSDFFNNNFDKLIKNQFLPRYGGHNYVYKNLSKFLSTKKVRDGMMQFIEIQPRQFNNMNISPFCYCAIFSVAKDRILQHNINVYKKLIDSSIALHKLNLGKTFGFIMEFSWMEFFQYDPPIEIYPKYQVTNNEI